MKKIERFTNQYSISKTIQFSLPPVGRTAEHFDNSGILAQDEERARLYQSVKKTIDNFHKEFIRRKLSAVRDMDISDYAEIYWRTDNSSDAKKALKDCAKHHREQIVKALTKDAEGKMDPVFDKLFKKECITELIPGALEDAGKLSEVEQFRKFTTYFSGFYDNRKNMYTAEEQSTAIAYRCIDENLPRFLDNIVAFGKICEYLPQKDFDQLMEELNGTVPYHPLEQFKLAHFAHTLPQDGIQQYNTVIGGYAPKDGQSIRGINQYVNEYNQTHKDNRLPKLKPLYKQILSDRESLSFRVEPFEKDDDVLSDILTYCRQLEDPMQKLEELFTALEQYDAEGIFVRNNSAVTELSKELLGYWGQIRENWNEAYDASKKEREKKKAAYTEERDKAWKKLESISIADLERYAEGKSVVRYYKELVPGLIAAVRESFLAAEELLSTTPYHKEKKLAKNDADIALIKSLLDAVKSLENTLFCLRGCGTEAGRDSSFYGEFILQMEALEQIDRLYDKVRNYITKKPYSTDKIKLNFTSPTFLEGWAKNKESANLGRIYRKDGNYYLGILNRGAQKPENADALTPSEGEEVFEKMVYQQISDPTKDMPNLMVIDGKTVRKTGRKETDGPHAGENLRLEALRDQYLPAEINRIRKLRSFSKTSPDYSKEDLTAYIRYYMDRVTEYNSDAVFDFKAPEDYASYAEFCKEVKNQAYRVFFVKQSASEIMRQVEEGELFLFRIHSKDFSPHSKGTPNLHTLYFKMLFDEQNLRDTVYQLSGGAEMFYRHPSISEAEQVVHPAGIPIENRHPTEGHTHRVLPYDVIKDRRFTQRQFSLHLPIKLNFQATGKGNINLPVREAIRECENNYVIGIDRGERNLIYITVIDESGKIVEQCSCNIVSDGKSDTNYHTLLEAKEKDRLAARQNWKTIEGIKELKEGYVSQVVHRICQLVEKYDAVIAMEDLNSGFKNSRAKVEKQVYQKFEKMLIDKLNYMVDKKKDPEEFGGLLKAYQLAEKFESFRQMNYQNGFIFYIPAWLTSKIDPTTGFVDLLNPKYTSVEKSREMIQKFRGIRYNAAEDFFEIDMDYRDFAGCGLDSVGKWTLCTYGKRIRTHRDRNGKYHKEEVELPILWKSLFDDFSVDYRSGDLKAAILAQDTKDFHERFVSLLRLTLQMRNSDATKDYMISPVRNACGAFYDSEKCKPEDKLPLDADANGAYHIALKALWAIREIKKADAEALKRVKLSVSKAEWLAFAQSTAADRIVFAK